MINVKILGFLVLIAVIAGGVTLICLFDESPGVNDRDPATVQSSTRDLPSDFDWETYIQNYEDLRRAGIDTEKEAQQHWLEFGKNEKRSYRRIPVPPAGTNEPLPPDFDWETYINNYGDIQRADIHTREQAVEHWLTIGRKEGRTYRKIPYQPASLRPDFDWQTYVNNYEDLRAAGIDTKEKAIEHWLKQGKREGRTYLKITALANTSLFGFNLFGHSGNANDVQGSKEKAMEYWLKHWAEKTSS
ncbi:MAG: hypothetical protein WC530_00210 [Candidatus Omnitrophota bacterium]